MIEPFFKEANMKKLIVYYSMEGNTHYIAEKMAEKLSADLLRLVPKKAYIDKGFAKFISIAVFVAIAEKVNAENTFFEIFFGFFYHIFRSAFKN